MKKLYGLIGIFGIIVLVAGSACAVDGQIKIAQTASTEFPIVINKAGSYVLTSNLVVTGNVNAITIEVNDVALDLNGHMIQGPNTGTGNGIYALNRYTIAVKNGRIWGFGSYGISLQSEATHPSRWGAGHLIEGIQTANNGSGIGITGGIVTNCTANNNHDRGFYITRSTASKCTANNNLDSGSAEGFQAYRSTLTDCTSIKNDYGFYGDHSTFTNCTAVDNTGMGFYLYHSTVTNSTSNLNGSYGIDAEYDCTVTDCTVYQNGGTGITSLFRGAIKGCTVTLNSSWGISIPNTNASCYVYRNLAAGNTSGQISCASGNTCIDNAN